MKNGPWNFEDEVDAFLRDAGNRWPSDAATCPRQPVSSITTLGTSDMAWLNMDEIWIRCCQSHTSHCWSRVRKPIAHWQTHISHTSIRLGSFYAWFRPVILSELRQSHLLDELLAFYSLLVTWCTKSLTFNNCTRCPHCIYVFCIYLRTNSDLCHLQHKLFVFITQMKSVYSAVRTGYLNETFCASVVKGLIIVPMVHDRRRQPKHTALSK